MYLINESKTKHKKKKADLSKHTKVKDAKYIKGKTKKSILKENFLENMLGKNPQQEEEITENENNNNSQKVKNLIEDNFSQSSALTKSSLSSFWNINKNQTKDIQNNFTSKKFFKLQILLGIFLLILLILMIVLLWEIRRKQSIISNDCDNYLDLIQFIRVFQQFSVQFLTVVCVAIKDDYCKSYISQFDTEDFNQTLFFIEQNQILAEYGSDSINELIMNSESIQDEVLLNLLQSNFSYYLVSKRKI